MAEKIPGHHAGRSRSAWNPTGCFTDDYDRSAAAASHPTGTSGNKTHHATCSTSNAEQSKSTANASAAANFPQIADRYQQTYPAATANPTTTTANSATSTAATTSTG